MKKSLIMIFIMIMNACSFVSDSLPTPSSPAIEKGPLDIEIENAVRSSIVQLGSLEGFSRFAVEPNDLRSDIEFWYVNADRSVGKRIVLATNENSIVSQNVFTESMTKKDLSTLKFVNGETPVTDLKGYNQFVTIATTASSEFINGKWENAFADPTSADNYLVTEADNKISIVTVFSTGEDNTYDVNSFTEMYSFVQQ